MSTAVSKEFFLSQSNAKIKMYNAFVKALNELTTFIPAFDNKKMDKRFIDKVNEMFKNKNISVEIKFCSDYKGNRENRFKLYFCNNNNNLSYDDAQTYLYAINSIEPYIDKDTFKLNPKRFQLTIDRNIQWAEEKITSLTECIENIDTVIETFNEVNQYICDKMNTIPEPLRPYGYTIKCPVYL